MATIVAIVVHAVALLGDGFLHPSVADVSIPFVSSLYDRVGRRSGSSAGG